MSQAVYDQIGSDYRRVRRPDPRLADLIARSLGGATSVVNVGAGSGSYEPVDRPVVAVDPSRVMIGQRSATAATAVQALAEQLPFSDDAFDAALAVLTIHHWSDQRAGLHELMRVAREIVVLLTFDPASEGFWLTQEYFPDFRVTDRLRFPAIADLLDLMEDARAVPFAIPHDCTDGFLGAYWRRPEAYLEAPIRQGISSFATCGDLSPLRRLDDDLQTGRWHRRHARVLDLEELDIGYRLLVGRPRRSRA